MEKIYFEHQIEKDTCFRHAINHFFQFNYMELLRNHYSKLVLLHNGKIDEIKSQNAVSTFYENNENPGDITKLEEKSQPELDDDLHSYFQIYSETTAKDIIDQLQSCEYKELSATQLFEDPVTSTIQLIYVPHRSEDKLDIAYSTNRYIDVTSKYTDNQHSYSPISPYHKNNFLPLYLCRSQNFLAHAFCAIYKLDNEKNNWTLLDSLLNKPIECDVTNLFSNPDYAGSASIIIAVNKLLSKNSKVF